MSQNFSAEQLEMLISYGTRRTYSKNTLVITEGDKGDHVYVVISGKLKVFLVGVSGKEISVDTLAQNDYFGEMALDGEPRSASVMTLETSQLCMVQGADFKRFLTECPEASYALNLRLIHRARHLTRAIGSLALLDVYGRVARLLIDCARERDGQLVVLERMTHQGIATRVNCSRETVSRILTDLRDGDYIAIHQDHIVIRRRLPERW
jgi:CRP/FNR family transcriptional regulator, cyclic AMP receptor protein